MVNQSTSKLSEYMKQRERAQRSTSLSLTRAQEQAILKAYKDAGERLVKQIEASKGIVTAKMKQDYASAIAQQVFSIIKDYGMKNALNALENEMFMTLKLMGGGTLETLTFKGGLASIVDVASRDAVTEIISGGIYKDGAGLSARVWSSSARAANSIQEVVASAMAQNMSATELSKLLADYVNPNARRTWDKEKIKEVLGKGYASWNKELEYNALRLARTTITHSFTSAMKRSHLVNPYNEKFQWHSVHAAGRTCAICIEMDGNIYSTKDLPYDHPNGLCYVTHYFEQSLDEIADELYGWVHGEDNPKLETWWNERNKPFTDNTGTPKFVKN